MTRQISIGRRAATSPRDGDTPRPRCAASSSFMLALCSLLMVACALAAGACSATAESRTPETAKPLLPPDGRAWEMVSPPEKHGAPVEALTREGAIILAAENGGALTYVVDGAPGGEVQGNRSPEWQQVLATRTPGGWSSQDIATPQVQAEGAMPGFPPEYQLFSPDLSAAVVEPVGAEPPLSPEATQKTIYVRNNTSGKYLPLITTANVAPGTIFGGSVDFLSATPNLSHVVIASTVALTGPSSKPGLYEWAGGALQLVSVRPNGSPAEGRVELGYGDTVATALSADGARVVWTSIEEEPRLGHLYLRDTAREETIQLDAAQGAPEPAGRGTARFQSASSDGSRIFFTDRQRLTADSTAEPARNEPDLYVCEVTIVAERLVCDLRDLTGDRNKGEAANVQGTVLGTSEDGASVYLVAHGVLASNETANGEHALAGGDNVYEIHFDGTQWSSRLIATLSAEDGPEWQGNEVADTAYLTARLSPNGGYFAFMSSASLTGYDNIDSNPQANGARAEEVYLYDATTESLRCVSCDPTGAPPSGVLDAEGVGEGLGLLVDRRKVWFGHWLAGNVPGWTAESLTSALLQSRYLNNNGRLYFNSPDDLVAEASNHKEDVYEYEPSGVGGCVSSTGGCVSLISSGESPRESAFIEATPDGSDVFFVTASQLLPQDTDTAFDIYDARECTSTLPCLGTPAPAVAPCGDTEACRPAAPAQQLQVTPSGSASVAGSVGIASPAQTNTKVTGAETRPQHLTRAQKLKRGLRLCTKDYRRSKKRRERCEAHVRRLYGTTSARTKREGKAATASSGQRATARQPG